MAGKGRMRSVGWERMRETREKRTKGQGAAAAALAWGGDTTYIPFHRSDVEFIHSEKRRGALNNQQSALVGLSVRRSRERERGGGGGRGGRE